MNFDALIYLLCLAVYNILYYLSGQCTVECPDSQVYLSCFFYLVIFSALAYKYYKSSRYTVLNINKILDWIALLFSGLYIVYTLFLAFSIDFNDFMRKNFLVSWVLITVGFVMIAFEYISLWLIIKYAKDD